jgi:hypothetical protein
MKCTFNVLDRNYKNIGFGEVHFFNHRNNSTISIDMNACRFTINESDYDDYGFSIKNNISSVPNISHIIIYHGDNVVFSTNISEFDSELLKHKLSMKIKDVTCV